ncbi:g1606 [Coccomyxa elongata]
MQRVLCSWSWAFLARIAGREEAEEESTQQSELDEDGSLGFILSPSEPLAVIVGGGTCGALLALLLSEQGWLVNVYEKRPREFGSTQMVSVGCSSAGSFPRMTSVPSEGAWNVVLGQRSLSALEKAGVLQQVLERSVGLLGEMTVRSDAEDEFTRYPFQAICISEAFLAQTLVSAAMQRYPRQIRYHFSHKCTGVDFNTNGALFVSEANSDAERMASSAVVIKKSPPADLLIGADGANSTVRMGMMSHAPMFGFSQVFHPDQLYKAVSVVLRPGALGPDRRAVRPRPMRRRRRPLLQLCDAVYTLRRTHEGQPVVCQLLPNLDRSYSLVWGGRALLQYFEADQIRQLFHAAFPEVALLLPDSVYGALAAASLLTFPVVSCSRMHHNGAVLVGAAAHAMFPDMHISTDAGVEDCVRLAESLRESGGAQSTGRLRGALRALSAERLPAAAAAARLARAAAPRPGPGPAAALARLRWHMLLRCSSGLRSLALLPWELKSLGTSASYQDIQRWRTQEAFLVTGLLLCGASAAVYVVLLVTGQLHVESLYPTALGRSVDWLQGAFPAGSRFWMALVASVGDARKALCAKLSLFI